MDDGQHLDLLPLTGRRAVQRPVVFVAGTDVTVALRFLRHCTAADRSGVLRHTHCPGLRSEQMQLSVVFEQFVAEGQEEEEDTPTKHS